MSWFNMPESKVRVAIQFIEILKNNNCITVKPVEKKIIIQLFKNFIQTEKVEIKFYELLQFMLYIKLVRNIKNRDKNYIFFRPQVLTKILLDNTDTSNAHRNIKNGNLNKTNVQNSNSLQHIPTKDNKTRQYNKHKNNFNSTINSEQNATYVQILNSNNRNNNANQNTQPNDNSASKKKRKKRTFVKQNILEPLKRPENKYVTKEKCAYCNCRFYNDEQYTKHIQDIQHKLRKTYRTNKKSLLNEMNIIDFVTERGGLTLTEIKSNININNSITCKITNKNDKAVYEITEIILLYTKLKELKLEYSLPILLKSGNSQKISIHFSFRNEGTYILPIIFKIQNKTNKNEVPKYLLKEMVFYIKSDSVNSLESSSHYKRNNTAVSHLEDIPIIDGVLPPKDDTLSLTCVVPLRFYDLPKTMTKLINWGLKMNPKMTPEEQDTLIEIRNLLNVHDRNNCLTPKNHCKMLKTLLEFEEHQMWKDIRNYDCDDQTMKLVPTRGQYKLLALEVPGLAENRPSLIKGDDLLVKTPGGKCYYKGYIHRVNETTIELGFFQRYVIESHFDAQKYSVTFGFNRRTIRTEHQAIELVKKHNISHFFFPKKLPKPRPLDAIQFVWYQTNIKNNPEQQQAVRHIVSGTSYPNPYLLFGPPGTGKTMTMVESILQLWSRKPNSRILVAAPSNSAANEVTSRLVQFIGKKDIFRMISQSFAYDKVPDKIKPISNTNEGQYFYPAMETLEKYRIIIVTLTAAARFVWGGVTPGHFTHIFIDESGHSTESEVLIPIAGIISDEMKKGQLLGHIILAGDPKQLGPIIHSKLAKSFGFGTSMLERLMNTCELYQKEDNKYNPNMVTKLLKNFRSNRAILKLPDEMFYDNELIAEGNDLTDIALGWKELPNEKFPLLFHNVQGEDKREKRSPSYYNDEEVKIVVKYLKSLVGKRLKGRLIKETDIGVVSPYRKQVHKLQEECKKNHWYDILIGSVEQFQGQERLIIIISTVRSKLELLEHDYKFHLGFLKNPKRFNVAITRAKALVIVIGNPKILMWDEHWGKFIEYCSINNALKGPRFEFKKLWLCSGDNNNNNELENSSIESEIIHETREHADFSRGNT